MKPDTPLVEVAHHLPREAAAFLLANEPGVQEVVLKHVRSIIVFWEETDPDFNPLVYEPVLNALVPSLTPLYNVVKKQERDLANANTEIAILRTRLAGAELLINALKRASPEEQQPS